MIKQFRLPDLGEGLTESEILSWKVGVGDTVSLNQVIAEVETAKAVVELPSPFAGVIKELHEQPGTIVEVGKPLVSFEVADDDGAPAPVPPAAPASQPGRPGMPANQDTGPRAEEPRRRPNLVGYGAVVESSGRPARRPRNLPAAARAAGTKPAGPPVAGTKPAGTAPRGPALRPKSTPPVRKLAKELGVDLEAVPGTGPTGLITRKDVQDFAAQQGFPAEPGFTAEPEVTAEQEVAQEPGQVLPAAVPGRESRAPIKGVRKLTAAAMVESAFTAPHVTEFLTVDVTSGMDLLAKLQGNRDFAGAKLTPLTLAAKAVLVALRRNPALNARWDEANQEIVTFNYVNLGIAAATPRGLTVPNIKDADSLSLVQLAEALADLTEKARSGRSTPADLSGGTISITNIGVFGIDAGTPILNPGEAAILALGAVRKMPWEHHGGIALRQVLTLSLSFDHRLVDGEQGSRFLADVGAVLADPGMVLAMV